MSPRTVGILVLIGPLVLGLARLMARNKQVKQRIDFATEYTNTFMQFAQADAHDAPAYTWLLRNSFRMQEEMGSHGIAYYTPPGSFQYISNYPVILNLLPEIMGYRQQALGNCRSTYRDMVRLYWETLTRYIGVLEQQFEQSKGRLSNPFIWMQTGMQTIILVPVFILSWLGLVGRSAVGNAESLGFVKIISGLATLVQLVSALIAIVLGWDEFVRLVTDLWQGLL